MSLKTVCLRICVVSTLFWAALFFALHWQRVQQEERSKDPRWTIRRIAARPLTQDRLPIVVLSELLHLQRDVDVSLFACRPQNIAKMVQRCPAVKKARAWRLLPGTLGIEYALRTPIAMLSGVKNVALDSEGRTFFLFPFYPPKRLPSVVLPIEMQSSLSVLQRELFLRDETSLALGLVQKFSSIGEKEHLFLDLVDVSQMRHGNMFRREVIVAFTSISRNEKLYVRMNPKTILSEIDVLPEVLHACIRQGFQPGIIDMRFGEYAIVSKELVMVPKSLCKKEQKE